MFRSRETAVLLMALSITVLSATANSAEQDEVLLQTLNDFKKQPNMDAINNEFESETKGTFGAKKILNRYDFVIVGAGPSGCVLANRLSENPEWKVLLIEAGERENLFVKVPVLAAYMQSTSYNWGYLAERQNYSCWGMKDQRCGLPRGKGLGGSTLLNYMMYVRGNRADFDRWAKAGNPGWSYEETLPYFKKSERSFLNISNGYHGSTGPLDVRFAPYQTKMSRIFINSLQELGMPLVDYNGERQLGVSRVHASIRDGQRLSASSAFLDPVSRRPNLHILINSRATRILIEPKTKTAYGVEFVRGKNRYVVIAKKEVLLTAGGLQSPQLLMVSGIGPKDHLKNIGVPVIQDLPVGKIIYDHVYFTGVTFVTNTLHFTLKVNRVVTIPMFIKFLQGDGPMTIPGGVEAVGFLNTRNSSREAVPDIELIFVNGSPASDQGSGIREGLRLNDDTYESYRSLESDDKDAFTVNIVLLHPKSRGYMELKSSNPFQWPKFYMNFLKEEEDVETLLRGIKRLVQIIDTPSMKRYRTRLHNLALPNCAQFKLASDDYWRCALRTQATSTHHQTAACKMGPAQDPEAVVSSTLQVHGITNLRVADVSVIPVTFSGHPAAHAYMIGEKLADMIKEHWRES